MVIRIRRAVGPNEVERSKPYDRILVMGVALSAEFYNHALNLTETHLNMKIGPFYIEKGSTAYLLHIPICGGVAVNEE